jgi:hypothetical protein
VAFTQVTGDLFERGLPGNRFRPGDVFVWPTADLVVYNLAIQPLPRPPADLDAIATSVRAALADAHHRQVTGLGLPRLGAGLGGLAWPDVEAVLRKVGGESPVDLIVVSLPDP